MASHADLLKEFDPLGSSEQSRPADIAPSTAPVPEEAGHSSGDPKDVLPDHKESKLLHSDPALPHSDPALPHSDSALPHSDPVLPHSDPALPHSDPALPHSDQMVLSQASVGPSEADIDLNGLRKEGIKQHQEGIKQHQEGVITAAAPTPQSAAADNTNLPVPSPSSSGPASSEKRHRSHKHKKRSLRDKEKADGVQKPAPPTVPVVMAPITPVAMAPLAPVPDLNLAQTQMEMMQIDSILKALSSGGFDSSSLAAISNLTSLPKAPPIAPSTMAETSLGLQLISQLQSGEESSSSESESDESSDEEDDIIPLAPVVDEEDGEEEKGLGRKYGYPTVPGEVDYRDLPPVEKRNIPFPEGAELAPIGKVSHITEKLVVIEALAGVSPVNEGTVVWSKEKECLGEIFETFGPVKNPFYSLLTNNEQELAPSLAPGQLIYVVPNNQTLTRYVFTTELMKQKGCDASWRGDIEVPSEMQEHSDDDAESKSKRKDRDDKPRKDDKKVRSDRLQKTSSVVYSSDPMMKAYFQGPSQGAPPPARGMVPPLPYGYPPPPLQGQYPAYPSQQQSPQAYPGGPAPYPRGHAPYYPPGGAYYPHGFPPYAVSQGSANYPGPPHFQAPPHGYQGPPRGCQPQW